MSLRCFLKFSRKFENLKYFHALDFFWKLLWDRAFLQYYKGSLKESTQLNQGSSCSSMALTIEDLRPQSPFLEAAALARPHYRTSSTVRRTCSVDNRTCSVVHRACFMAHSQRSTTLQTCSMGRSQIMFHGSWNIIVCSIEHDVLWLIQHVLSAVGHFPFSVEHVS